MIRQKVCGACLACLGQHWVLPYMKHLGIEHSCPAQVEPEIVGGIIVQMADKYIDLSIRTRVKKIEQLILEAV